MDNFNELVLEVEKAKQHADKFYADDNLSAGKRLFSSLMEISRKCKKAREELSEQRKHIKRERGIKY